MKTPPFQKSKHIVPIYIVLFLFTSCVAINNVYLNDPEPAAQDELKMHLGFGTGLQTIAQVNDTSGLLQLDGTFRTIPTAYFGIQGAFDSDTQWNYRLSVHTPYIIAGIGLRVGAQYSFFQKKRKFNMALGADVGGVISKKQITVFKQTFELPTHSNGALNADLFVPICFKFNTTTKVAITPRYSFNALFMRYNIYDRQSYIYLPSMPSATIGVWRKNTYFEMSAHLFENKIYPNFGLLFNIKHDSD